LKLLSLRRKSALLWGHGWVLKGVKVRSRYTSLTIGRSGGPFRLEASKLTLYRLVHDLPDRSQRMIPPHPRLQVNVAEQLALSIVATAHAMSPNLVGANESRSPADGERLFSTACSAPCFRALRSLTAAVRTRAVAGAGIDLAGRVPDSAAIGHAAGHCEIPWFGYFAVADWSQIKIAEVNALLQSL
jgi:hypothetical protein